MTLTDERMRRPATLARSPLVAVGAGIATGLLARALYAVLPEPWTTLANTSALWGLLPFTVAALTRTRGSRAILLGMTALAAMVVTWAVLGPESQPPRVLVLWGIVAIGAGALCGLAGDLAGRRQPLAHRLGLAVMSGLVLGEAFYGALLIGGPQWWGESALGLLLALGGGRRWPDRAVALALVALMAASLFGVYLLFDAIAAG
ncbi:hypothetical protein E3O25_09815 [Cryobacterium sp. TMT1-3]|uniref:DUF6518 family protein n=1 Tax=Cryobacterium sp. TMT1-3 TaxID=1259237 RepID=UPI00106A13F6|nr:DUF6518 family protein [Cryobacterium sp. TMT1-3]TFC27392.1 hypothetical protein E3O25_09815 [Cryobacterium sp. TMT1-3]